MANCLAGCPREIVSAGPPSPGPVADSEYLCRAAFGMHVKGIKLKKSVIRRTDVESGELSVWRVPDLDPIGLSALAAKVPPPLDDALDRFLAVQAREIRDLQGPDQGSRAFSVIDDTRTDNAGGRDSQHAALAPCKGWDLADPIVLDDLVNRLYLLFKGKPVWP